MGKITKTLGLTIFSLVWVTMATAAYAAPTISVTRTPSVATEGDSYSVSWKSSWAIKIGYQCSGSWVGSQDDISKSGLWLDGMTSGVYNANYLGSNFLGTTDCIWTATAADGSSTKFIETFKVSAKTNNTNTSTEFKITKINGIAYTGTPTPIPADAKSFVVEGVGAQGKNIVIGGGSVWANVPANADGTWSATITNGIYGAGFQFAKSGVMFFPVEAIGGGTVSKTANFSINIQWDAPELSHLVCTKTYFLANETGECSISTRNSNTKFVQNSGYTMHGDMAPSRVIEPVWNTELPGTYSNGIYTVKIINTYHGYLYRRNVWFENSSGKSEQIELVFRDQNSDEYKKVNDYQNIQTPWTNTSTTFPTTGSGTSQTAPSAPVSSNIANPSVLFINGVTVSGPTMGVGLAAGVIVTNESITGYPETALKSFAAQGSGPVGKKIRVYSSKSQSVFETDVNSIGRWWIDKSTQGNKAVLLESFLTSGENILTFKTYNPATGKESEGFKFRITTPMKMDSAVRTQETSIGTGTSTNTLESSLEKIKNTTTTSTQNNPYTPYVSASLKTKLDAAIGLLEKKAITKGANIDGALYLQGIEKKLEILADKYQQARKFNNMAAILYLAKEVDALNNKLFSDSANNESMLLRDIQESY